MMQLVPCRLQSHPPPNGAGADRTGFIKLCYQSGFWGQPWAEQEGSQPVGVPRVNEFFRYDS
jgi:hypothetical protein